MLFIILIVKINKNIKEKTGEMVTIVVCRNMQPVKMSSIIYAVIVVNSTQKKQKLVYIWVNKIQKMNIEVNMSKSKVNIINKKQEMRNKNDIKCKRKSVNLYEYLEV